MGLHGALISVTANPLNRGRELPALGRFIAWQIKSRFSKRLHKVQFVNETVLLVRSGMRGATLNIYCGLSEPEDMTFAFHFLRGGDLFADVGANVGVYSILAGAAGAHVISFEPVPSTYEALAANVVANGFLSIVETVNMGVGASRGTLHFTQGYDTMNRVAESTTKDTVRVDVDTLDSLLPEPPCLIKVDVEGFEAEVFRGAPATLADPKLNAIIVELNGSGEKYGFSDGVVRGMLAQAGFSPYSYDYLSRNLTPLEVIKTTGNTIFVRNYKAAQDRLRSSAPLRIATGLEF